MSLTVWFAFASNNSGSYTIVGRFREASLARATADELARVCAEHSAWLAAQDKEGAPAGPSPLERFAREHGLRWQQGTGEDDDWPQYGDDPSVTAAGTQVLLHVPYTVTMPALFGEHVYRQQGRVETELEHAHNPLVAQLELWWPYRMDAEEKSRSIAAVAAALEALEEPALRAALERPEHDAPGDEGLGAARARRVLVRSTHWMHAPITVYALFEGRLVEGVAAVDALVSKHGGSLALRVLEALDDKDPLAPYRAHAAQVAEHERAAAQREGAGAG